MIRKMKIIHIKDSWPPNNGEFENCIVINDDRWDDFGYRTSFNMTYFNKKRERKDIGEVKIYHLSFDEESIGFMGKTTSDIIEDTVTQLGEYFCSLGQTLNYYQNLKEACPNDYMDILNRLNDIAINEEIKNNFIQEYGVKASLLRFSSAEKALNEAVTLLKESQLENKDISFNYYVKVPYNEERIELPFCFDSNNGLPYRINALIGKNGVGKTEILSSLAESLSGYAGSDTEKEDSFNSKRPPIDRVISISFSAFDSFRKRSTKNNKYNLNSYAYCGIQSEQGTLSLNDLKSNFLNSYEDIKNRYRLDSWENIMSELIENEFVESIKCFKNNGNIDEIHWSSGQYILLCAMTEVISKIEKESILLFDEPELHLHPNAVANMLRMLYKLLEEFNSYAIIATHSPLIIQEIPSKYVLILSRLDNVLSVRRPEIECFGDNVTTITNDVFDVSGTESNYKTVLKNLSKKLSFEEVLDLFEGKLSFNAMIYLKTCYLDE